jgi:hypothetical protein
VATASMSDLILPIDGIVAGHIGSMRTYGWCRGSQTFSDLGP